MLLYTKQSELLRIISIRIREMFPKRSVGVTLSMSTPCFWVAAFLVLLTSKFGSTSSTKKKIYNFKHLFRSECSIMMFLCFLPRPSGHEETLEYSGTDNLECGQVGEIGINISGLQTKMKYDTTAVDCHAGGELTLRATGPCACHTEWEEPSNDWMYCVIDCRVDGRKLSLDYSVFAKEAVPTLVREKRRAVTTRGGQNTQTSSTVEKAKKVQESWDEQVGWDV